MEQTNCGLVLRAFVLIKISAVTVYGGLYGQARLEELEITPDYRILDVALAQPIDQQFEHIKAHKGDSLALVAFYFSTSWSANWRNSSGWLRGWVSEWYGIRLDSTGRVIEIRLEGNGLTGKLTSRLAQLANLEHLILGAKWIGNESKPNSITGTIPPEFSNLSKLRSIDLNQNQLAGKIPSSDVLPPNLETLDLSFNNFSGSIPPELGQLARIKQLNLSGNRLSGAIPEELGKLSELEYLILYRNNLSGFIPPALGQLASLSRLYINSNNFEGPIPPEIGQLANLERLYLQRNNLSGSIPPELGRLGELRVLQLNANRISGHIPSDLSKLDSLRAVRIDRNYLSGPLPDWTGLSELEDVFVHSNQFLIEDLLPSAALSRLNAFTYAPQDSINTQLTCISRQNVFTTATAAQGNRYQWYRNNEPIPNEQSNTLRVDAAENPAVYHVTVTNGALPALTLVSRKTSTRHALACQAGQFAHEVDSLVLVEFFNNTEGRTWTTQTGWLQQPVSEWHGIELDSTGRVTEIYLQGNGLAGKLPGSLGRLASLEFLDLSEDRSTFPYSYNAISGEIPPELGQLVELTRLNLQSNQLGGAIPEELSLLTNLESLNLAANGLTGAIPEELSLLTNLESLDLAANRLTGAIPEELSLLTNLESLNLAANGLTGGIPSELASLTQLKELKLYLNPLAGGIPTELRSLTNLVTLHLSDCGLTGEIPPELGELTKLSLLYLFDNQLTGVLPPQLGQLVELSQLLLSRNDFSGPIPPELGQLVKLKRLNLDSNNFSGSIPVQLGRLAMLWDLNLVSNNFSGSIPPELGKLQSLSRLSLQQNSFSGHIPPGFAQLSRLEELYLNNNGFSGPMPDLTQLDRLRRVRVQSNKFLFEDLLPNATLSQLNEFSYNPQERIETLLTCDASGYYFTTPDTAEGNQYQWYRNGEAIPGAQSDTLRLSIASDLDEYHAAITNDALPELTLVSRRARLLGATPCSNVRYANAADSTLLVDFYNRTHGSLLWHTDTGWLEAHVAQWYGITLDAAGRVTDINLPNNNLVGQLPLSQLDQLPHLRRLDVSGNEFSGVIPKGLGALTQLEYLDLSRNTLAGELPKELAGQAPLRVLNVSGNQLVGTIPTELSQISTLQTFSVSANQLSGPVPAFTGLDQLDTLHVAQNAFLFMDLLPNASLTRLDDFVYAPQDSVETLLTRTASGFALTTAAKAADNRYQWYRDDQPISGPQSDTLQVSATSDPAQYHATITNDRLPDLTLVSRKKGVHDGLTLTETDIPQDFLLHQSYPNPFAEATTVAFELGTPEHVRIVVYDLLGKAVATIAHGRFTAGVHRIEFTGDQLASGQYMYRMEAGAYQATRFMSVIR